MAEIETFVIQPFHIHRKKLTASPRSTAKTSDQALTDGRRVASSRPGAAVLRILADDETGEPSSIEAIGRFGEIPEEFEEQIRAL